MTPPKRAKQSETPAERETPLRVVGIDLGTTNSTIAEARWGSSGAAPKVRCVEVEQATAEGTYTHVLFPSVVAIRGERGPGCTPRPCRRRARSSRRCSGW